MKSLSLSNVSNVMWKLWRNANEYYNLRNVKLFTRDYGREFVARLENGEEFSSRNWEEVDNFLKLNRKEF